jgi:hypothetical protein
MKREGNAQLDTGRREPACSSVVALGVNCDAFSQPPALVEDEDDNPAGQLCWIGGHLAPPRLH